MTLNWIKWCNDWPCDQSKKMPKRCFTTFRQTVNLMIFETWNFKLPRNNLKFIQVLSFENVPLYPSTHNHPSIFYPSYHKHPITYTHSKKCHLDHRNIKILYVIQLPILLKPHTFLHFKFFQTSSLTNLLLIISSQFSSHLLIIFSSSSQHLLLTSPPQLIYRSSSHLLFIVFSYPSHISLYSKT